MKLIYLRTKKKGKYNDKKILQFIHFLSLFLVYILLRYLFSLGPLHRWTYAFFFYVFLAQLFMSSKKNVHLIGWEPIKICVLIEGGKYFESINIEPDRLVIIIITIIKLYRTILIKYLNPFGWKIIFLDLFILIIQAVRLFSWFIICFHISNLLFIGKSTKIVSNLSCLVVVVVIVVKFVCL